MHIFIRTWMIFLVFISHISVLQGDEEDVADTEKAWVACETRSDCIKVKGFCKLPAAINHQYRKDFSAYVRKNRKSVNCSRYKNMNYERVTEIACESQVCRLIIP